MNTATASPLSNTCGSSEVVSNWLVAELTSRYHKFTGRDLILKSAKLFDPEILAILDAEIRLIQHDSWVFTSHRTMIYRHLLRVGFTYEEVARMLDLAPHTVRTGASNVRAALGRQVRHEAEFRYHRLGPDAQLNKELISENLDHPAQQAENRKGVHVIY
jgi:DNA-binding CsgD family transcriptional regulator